MLKTQRKMEQQLSVRRTCVNGCVDEDGSREHMALSPREQCPGHESEVKVWKGSGRGARRRRDVLGPQGRHEGQTGVCVSTARAPVPGAPGAGRGGYSPQAVWPERWVPHPPRAPLLHRVVVGVRSQGLALRTPRSPLLGVRGGQRERRWALGSCSFTGCLFHRRETG